MQAHLPTLPLEIWYLILKVHSKFIIQQFEPNPQTVLGDYSNPSGLQYHYFLEIGLVCSIWQTVINDLFFRFFSHRHPVCCDQMLSRMTDLDSLTCRYSFFTVGSIFKLPKLTFLEIVGLPQELNVDVVLCKNLKAIHFGHGEDDSLSILESLKPSSLPHLEVLQIKEFFPPSSVPIPSLKKLLLVMPDNKVNLKEVVRLFPNLEALSVYPKSLEYFFGSPYPLSMLTKLTSLEINQRSASKDESVQEIPPRIQHLTTLGFASVSALVCRYLSSDRSSSLQSLRTNALPHRISAFTNLTSLDVSPDGISKNQHSFKHLTQLQHVGLTIDPEDRGQDLKVFESFKNLKSLQLVIQGICSEDEGDTDFSAFELCKQLKQLTQLESLDISFPDSVDFDLIAFFDILTNLKQLKALNYELTGHHHTISNITPLEGFHAISRLTTLQFLDLRDQQSNWPETVTVEALAPLQQLQVLVLHPRYSMEEIPRYFRLERPKVRLIFDEANESNQVDFWKTEWMNLSLTTNAI